MQLLYSTPSHPHPTPKVREEAVHTPANKTPATDLYRVQQTPPTSLPAIRHQLVGVADGGASERKLRDMQSWYPIAGREDTEGP